MGTVIELKQKINDSYNDLKLLVDQKLVLVDEKIKSKLSSDVSLIEKMVSYHFKFRWKKE